MVIIFSWGQGLEISGNSKMRTRNLQDMNRFKTNLGTNNLGHLLKRSFYNINKFY